MKTKSRRENHANAYEPFSGTESGGVRLGAPLTVTAKAYVPATEEWGVELEFQDAKSRTRRLFLPADLIESPASTLKLLRSNGYEPPADPRQKKLFVEHIAREAELLTETIDMPRQVGWHGGAYLLPKRTIGKGDKVGAPRLHTEMAAIADTLQVSGDLDDWKNLADLCKLSSSLVVATCCSLAAPLLSPAGHSGALINFIAPEPAAANALVAVADAVWRKPAPTLAGSELISARKMNGLKLSRNDSTAAILHEAGARKTQVNRRLKFATALLSGAAELKARGRSATPVSVPSRIIAIASGPDPWSGVGLDSLLGDKSSGRALAVDVFGGEEYGDGPLLDRSKKLSGPDGRKRSSARIAKIAKTAMSVHGSLGLTFLEHIVEQDDLTTTVGAYVSEFRDGLKMPEAGFELEVIDLFALAYAAGQLAVDGDLLPWNRTTVRKSAASCLHRVMRA